MVVLMHDFIALDVNSPIGSGIYSCKCFVGLDGKYSAVFSKGVVPGSLNNFDFGVYVLYESEGVVVGVTHRHDHFVAEG